RGRQPAVGGGSDREPRSGDRTTTLPPLRGSKQNQRQDVRTRSRYVVRLKTTNHTDYSMTQPPFRPASLADLRINPHRWSSVEDLTRRLVADDLLPAVAIQLIRNGRCLPQPLQAGRQRLDDESADTLDENAIFLVASITKPVVAMGVLRLLEQGELSLNDRVVDLL